MLDLENIPALNLRLYDAKYGSRFLCCLQKLSSHISNSLNESGLESTIEETVVKDIPTQNNDEDCGPFLVVFAKHILLGASFEFTERDMKHYRMAMRGEILNQQIEPLSSFRGATSTLRRFENRNLKMCWLNTLTQILLRAMESSSNFQVESEEGRILSQFLDPSNRAILSCQPLLLCLSNQEGYSHLQQEEQDPQEGLMALNKACQDIPSLFRFDVVTKEKCHNSSCQSNSEPTMQQRSESFWRLHIQNLNEFNVKARLEKDFSSRWTIDESRKCPMNVHNAILRQNNLVTSPELLFVFLERHQTHLRPGNEPEHSLSKTRVSIPHELTLKTIDANVRYFLFGIIEYDGKINRRSGCSTGHYYAFIKKNGWHRVSDSNTMRISAPSVSSKCVTLAYSNKIIV